MEYAIEYLEAEIDSLKDAYHQETNVEMKTTYSSRIVDCKKAVKRLKE